MCNMQIGHEVVKLLSMSSTLVTFGAKSVN